MINYLRISKIIIFALVVPVTLGGVADIILGMAPYLLIASSVICIPLSTIWVTRLTLTELDQIIEQSEAEVAQALEVLD